MSLEKILVPLDGSDLAETALEAAGDLLLVHPDASLVLVRAAEPSTKPGGDRAQERGRAIREAESYLTGVAAGLCRAGVCRVKTSVWYGPAAATIVEAADAERVDVIVMTCRGAGSPSRMILGTVAEAVLRGTRTPILLVRDVGAPVSPPLGAPVARSSGEATLA